ncbi:MAG: hypothetical protein ACHQJ6_03690 [Candidatus Berkiellales bacterium]
MLKGYKHPIAIPVGGLPPGLALIKAAMENNFQEVERILDAFGEKISRESKEAIAQACLEAIDNGHFDIFKYLLMNEIKSISMLEKGKILLAIVGLCNQAFKLKTEPQYDLNLRLCALRPSLGMLGLDPKDIPCLYRFNTVQFDLQFMPFPETPTLPKLVAHRHLIPLLVKDPQNKLWLYGKDPYGKEILTKLDGSTNNSLYDSFRSYGDRRTVAGAMVHPNIYGDIAQRKAHVHNEFWIYGCGAHREPSLRRLETTPDLIALPFDQKNKIEKKLVNKAVFEAIAHARGHYLPQHFHKTFLNMATVLLEEVGTKQLPQPELATGLVEATQAGNILLKTLMERHITDEKPLERPPPSKYTAAELVRRAKEGSFEELEEFFKASPSPYVESKEMVQACFEALNRGDEVIFATIFKKYSKMLENALKVNWFHDVVLFCSQGKQNYFPILSHFLLDEGTFIAGEHKGWALRIAIQRETLKLANAILTAGGAEIPLRDLIWAMDHVPQAQRVMWASTIQHYATQHGITLVSPQDDIQEPQVPSIAASFSFDEVVLKIAGDDSVLQDDANLFRLARAGTIPEMEGFVLTLKSVGKMTPARYIQGIIQAIENDNKGVIRCLVESFKDTFQHNRSNYDFYIENLPKMLIAAVNKGNVEYLEILLEKLQGRPIEVAKLEVLGVAARHGVPEVVQFLLEKNKKQDEKKAAEAFEEENERKAEEVFEKHVDKKAEEAFCIATKHQRIEVVKYLFGRERRNFVHRLMRSNPLGVSLLALVRMGTQQQIEQLLEEHIDEIPSMHLEEAFGLAVEELHKESLVNLLDSCAKGKISGHFRRALFHRCAKLGDFAGLRLAHLFSQDYISLQDIEVAQQDASQHPRTLAFLQQLSSRVTVNEEAFANFELNFCPKEDLTYYKGLLLRYYTAHENVRAVEFLLADRSAPISIWDKQWALEIARVLHNLMLVQRLDRSISPADDEMDWAERALFPAVFAPGYAALRSQSAQQAQEEAGAGAGVAAAPPRDRTAPNIAQNIAPSTTRSTAPSILQ